MFGKKPAPENKHREPVTEEKYVLNRGSGIHKRHGKQRIEPVCDSCYDSRNVADKGIPVKFSSIHHGYAHNKRRQPCSGHRLIKI